MSSAIGTYFLPATQCIMTLIAWLFMILTFKYSPQASEVHLVRAVEDHNVLSQTATHVFYGLGLSW